MQAERQWVHANAFGHAVHLGLDRERGLQVAVAAEGAGIGVVGVDRQRVVLAMRHPVQRGEGLHHHEGRGRAPRGIGSVVVQCAHRAEGQRAVALAARAQGQAHRLARRRSEEFLLAVEHQLDRSTGRPCQVDADDLERIDVELGAEAAADGRLDDADASRVHVQDLGELALVQERDLGVRIQHQVALGVEFGDHTRHAHAAMGHIVQREVVLDDKVRFGLALRHVAMAVVEAHRDVVGASGQADRRARARARDRRVHQRRVGVERARGVGQRRQVLVFDRDQRQRLARDLLAVGGDRGDLVTLAAHAVALERQVIARDTDRALIGQIGGGQYCMYTGQGTRGAGVDLHDARVHPAGTQDGSVQLARQVDVLYVAGLAAGFFWSIHLADALSDKCAHDRPPMSRRAPASTMASTIFW